MAWRSSGNTNKEMVDNLKRNGLILTSEVEKGFRQVDRKFFVPKGMEDEAHLDQPLKKGNLHISAPHIYSSSLEELELEPNSAQTFLNVGSGTGYLSCIVASILGPKSLNYGVEIHKDAVQHSLDSIKQYHIANNYNFPKQANNHLQIIHGNGLHISKEVGECRNGFDRIYIGAAVSEEDFLHFEQLLALGGVLVGPMEDELVKVIRINRSSPFSEEKDFLVQVISCVCFAPLMKSPKIPTKIPICDSYHTHPLSYQKSVLTVSLCSNANYYQYEHSTNNKKVNVNLAATLPRDVWIYIFTFTDRRWFEPKDILETKLEKRILEAKQRKEKEEANKCQEADELMITERHLYHFLLLARRHHWQIPAQLLLSSQDFQEDDNIADADDHAHQQNNDNNENNNLQSNNDYDSNSSHGDSAMEEDDNEQEMQRVRLNGSPFQIISQSIHDDNDNNNHPIIERYDEELQVQQDQQEADQMDFDSSVQTTATFNINRCNDGVSNSRRTVSMDIDDSS